MKRARLRFAALAIRLCSLSLAFGYALAHGASAQSLLVETSTLTVSRESVRVYVQELRLDTGAPSPLATRLPGAAPAGALHLCNDAVITALSDSGHGPISALAGFPIARPEVGPDARRDVDLQEAIFVGTTTVNGGPPRAALVSTSGPGPLHGRGRMDVWTFSQGPPFVFAEKPASWWLPGAPVAAVANPLAGWVAALCKMPNGASVVHVRDTVRGRVIQERVPIARPSEQLEPVTLALAPDGMVLLVVLDDIGTSSSTDEGRCWAAPVDARGFAPIGPPLELPGTTAKDGAIAFVDGNTCWIATRSPSAGFAYLRELARENDHFAVKRQRSFTGVASGPLLAVSQQALAVAIDRRVEIWPEGSTGGTPLEFPARVNALCWNNDTLLIGEANRVHAVGPDRNELWRTALQTGQVVGMHPVKTTLDQFADTDNDGIPDPLDPEPEIPSPRLEVPARIEFREKAAGTELRAIRIDSKFAQNAAWRVEIDPDAPWLRVFPKEGRVPGWFMAGVDPSQRSRPGEARATITVRLSGAAAMADAANSPCHMDVHLLPRSASDQKILWLASSREWAKQLAPLAQLLSGPPFYWSHENADGRPSGPIDGYAAVLMNTNAIDAGVVGRQSLLDYVVRGGGLLIIAEAHTKDSSVSLRWLAPAGIVLEAAPPLSGTANPNRSHPIMRHWADFTMQNAARIVPDPTLSVLASLEDAPALAVRQFGRGRIAILSSPSPLEAAQMASRDNRLFALDLFEWLSRAIVETADMDADGLPDNLEDRNANGVVDPGETSKLDPDTDGDGVPDGKEDANANGTVDAGETNPLNPDTDGDGDLDGADFEPLPPAGAPIISSLVPVSGPAEGGTRVAIDGHNLGNIVSVRFGKRQAKISPVTSATGISIESPPAEGPEGGAVDVSVENADGRTTTLPGGFVYTARSNATLDLQAVVVTDAQYEGIVNVSIGAPPGVHIGRVVMQLDSDPAGALEWFDPRTTPDAELAGRRIVQSTSGTWGITLEITPPVRPANTMQLLTVRCRHRNPLLNSSSTVVIAREIDVRALNEEPLDASSKPAILWWKQPDAAQDVDLGK